MQTTLQWLRDLIKNPDSFLGPGFAIGLTTGLLLVLIVALIMLVGYRRRRSCGVLVLGDSGDLFITANALREFVARVLYEFGDASLNTVGISEHRTGLLLRVNIDVLPDVPVVPMVDRLRRSIIQQASERIGIERPVRVDVVVRSILAKERKIAKATRKVGIDPQHTRPYPVAETEASEI